MKIESAIRKMKCEKAKNNTPSLDIAYSMAIQALEKQKELKENCDGICSECLYRGGRGKNKCANDLLIDGLD